MPALFKRAGGKAIERFIQFFVLRYRNANTRESYARDIRRFAEWCDSRGIQDVRGVTPVAVAAFIEQLGTTHSAPTVKRHLASIRKLMDWLVTGHIIDVNPAWSVVGPKHVVKEGLTPQMSAEEVKRLLDSIPRNSLVGIRDRAVIAVLIYSWARVSAMCKMQVRDYAMEKGRRVFRLHEKGSKLHRVAAHKTARKAVEQYLLSAKLRSKGMAPLFQTIDLKGKLTGRPMTRNDAYRMVRRRARRAGLPPGICAHSCRATGVTEYGRNGGDIRKAASIANHSSIKTTQLYWHLDDDIELSEIERVK